MLRFVASARRSTRHFGPRFALRSGPGFALRLALLLASLSSLGGCGAGTIDDDSCTPQAGTASTVASLTIGRADLLTKSTDPFVALATGDPVVLVQDTQLRTLIPLRLRVTGASAPACLVQQSWVVDPSTGATAGTDTTSVNTYADPMGGLVTKGLFVPLTGGATGLGTLGSWAQVNTIVGAFHNAVTLGAPPDLLPAADLQPAADLAPRD